MLLAFQIEKYLKASNIKRWQLLFLCVVKVKRRLIRRHFIREIGAQVLQSIRAFHA